uniref:Uncharacterized protein n=1 Tax=Aegilops tauschii subsp. strangulata TaxID=200361 RepID=A0A452YLA3_AEGTS
TSCDYTLGRSQLVTYSCLATPGLFLFVYSLVQTVMKQGRLEPVETRVKNNKRGLGSKEPKPKPKVEDDVETAPSRRPKDAPVTKKAKLAAKRIRKMQEEEKKAQEREFEIAFFREFWPDNV